ncbi:MAG TPA: hypothetical protein VKI19_04930 [Acidimicrobiales bacterium]|nr:hypothetical protein [Acidimicrobiales bacterium]
MILDEGSAGGGRWRVVHERAPAGRLHADSAAALDARPVVRTVRFCHPTGPALVLGSHQDEGQFSAAALAAAGVELARRRSGGSAVRVGSGRVLWVDFVLPRDDPLWDDDVGRAAWWVGDLWAAALGRGDVWRGPMQPGAWSPVVCFAGLGPGEVTEGGRKMVGVSQRRRGGGAVFQTAALLDWRPDDYLSMLARPVADPAELASAAVAAGRSEAELESALVRRLMT